MSIRLITEIYYYVKYKCLNKKYKVTNLRKSRLQNDL